MIHAYLNPTSSTFIGLLLLFLLSGCQNLQNKFTHLSNQQQEQQLYELMHWQIKGKISFKYENERHNASIHWEQQKDNFDIHLFGPLGQGSTQLKTNPQGVTLQTADGNIRQATNPEQLMQESVGWQVPLSNIQQWIKGLPILGIPVTNTQRDELEFIESFTQQGWHVKYLNRQNYRGLLLPSKITISRNEMKLILLIKSWSLSQ